MNKKLLISMPTRAEQVLHFVKGPRILDVGCADHVPVPDSPYWLHGQLCKHFPMVVGIDVNTKNIEKLREFGYRNIYVANAEAFYLDLRFDTIVAGEIIEHLSNPGLFLKCAKEHLAPGGRIIITTPYPFALLNVLYAFSKFPKTCQNPEHTNWFCPQTLDELTRRVGLRVTYWSLIEDYRLDDVPSRRYRLFVCLISLLRWLVPKRLRCNAMLFVLEKDSHVS